MDSPPVPAPVGSPPCMRHRPPVAGPELAMLSHPELWSVRILSAVAVEFSTRIRAVMKQNKRKVQCRRRRDDQAPSGRTRGGHEEHPPPGDVNPKHP